MAPPCAPGQESADTQHDAGHPVSDAVPRARRATQPAFRRTRRHGPPFPSMDRPAAASSKVMSNIASTGFVESLVRPTGRGCDRCFLHDLGGAAEDHLDRCPHPGLHPVIRSGDLARDLLALQPERSQPLVRQSTHAHRRTGRL